jgi:hypothetical protein
VKIFAGFVVKDVRSVVDHDRVSLVIPIQVFPQLTLGRDAISKDRRIVRRNQAACLGFGVASESANHWRAEDESVI